MSRRYKAGLVTAVEPSSSGTPYTGAASGSWVIQRHAQSVYESAWPKSVGRPGAPTGVQASGGNAQATITFVAPVDNGGFPITSYVVTSSPGNFTGSGSVSPINVLGLTNGTTYTFTVKAINSVGESTASTASNSITPTAVVPTGQALFSVQGTNTWVAPAGVTSVSVVAIGGGGGGSFIGGGGGGLGWKNNISVNPGQSYTVVVGVAGNAGAQTIAGGNGGASYFKDTSTVVGYGGTGGGTNPSVPAYGGSYLGDGGGTGGTGHSWIYNFASNGGAGAGGYTGNGGNGYPYSTGTGDGSSGSGGGGGGGGGSPGGGAGGGGGVGPNGQGASGAGAGGSSFIGGGGGSGGSAGQSKSNRSDSGGFGGNYGGGGGGSDDEGPGGGQGANGCVRVIYGPNRAFPSTNTGE